MTIISIIVFLIFIGFGLWLIQIIPMNSTIKQIIIGIVIFISVLFIIQSFGFYNFGIKLGV